MRFRRPISRFVYEGALRRNRKRLHRGLNSNVLEGQAVTRFVAKHMALEAKLIERRGRYYRHRVPVKILDLMEKVGLFHD